MQAYLVLEDGTYFTGQSFTGPGRAEGEVIFNTAMTGYQEVLTDPSYCGQMVCMTYPHIGNYGVNTEDVESGQVWLSAFIVKECCKIPSSWRSTASLPDYLKKHGIMGIEGIDTRALTRHIRLHGAMRAVISTQCSTVEKLAQEAAALPSMEGQNLVSGVTTKKPYIWTEAGPALLDASLPDHQWPAKGLRLVVYDFGVKLNILRLLAAKGFHLLVVPAATTAQEVDALNPDAVFLSNGPGDPAVLESTIKAVAGLAEKYPLAGICLGHQILGLALGGKTYKLKFGHHGINHPVRDEASRRIEISSQNHGFCVDISTLKNVDITHINLNDQTLEGFAHREKPIIAIQYHPEAAPGPRDSFCFFERFKQMVQKAKKNGC